MIMSNKHIGDSWETVRQQLYTPTEIAESDLRVAIKSKTRERLITERTRGVKWCKTTYYSKARKRNY